MSELAVVILAAGKSTRMKSALSKVFHPVAGRPLITYPYNVARRLKPKKIVFVIGDGQKSEYVELLGKEKMIDYVVQKEAKGTGHAVHQAEKSLRGFDGYVLILPGDVPLISERTLEDFISMARKENATCSIISTEMDDPYTYGRILRDDQDNFVAIREEKDASGEEKMIHEINSGIFLVRAKWLFQKLKKIRPHNAQKEYYLPDVIEMGVDDGERVTAHCYYPPEQFTGVNDRADLSFVNKMMYGIIADYWMEEGVSVLDPDQTYIDVAAKIGNDTTIEPSVFLKGKTVIGKGCHIGTGCVIEDSRIGNNVHLKPYTLIEKGQVKDDSVVGPFARLRPEALLEKGVKVGNFVEIKKSVLKAGAKASHLSYIGDATIGAKTNVGCGTITCNYDGKFKHRTVIGEDVFIGSDVQFVAPVTVGKGATIGAGSTVTKNVPPGTLALSRSEQVNVKGWTPAWKRKKRAVAKKKKSK